MTEKSKKLIRVELGLNPVSIDFPVEPLQNTCRPNHKNPFCKDQRPQSANSTGIIHSVPQYRANVGVVKKGFFTSNNINQVKNDRLLSTREEISKNNVELGRSSKVYRQIFCMSAQTLKIKSMKIGGLNINNKFLVNKGVETGKSDGIVKKNIRGDKGFNKTKPESKKNWIEIGGLGLNKDRKLVKGKIIRNNLTFRNIGNCDKNVSDLMIFNSKR